MAFLDWKEDMSVGVHALDDDHKKLLGMINDLSDAIHSGKSHDVLKTLLDKLVEYTVFHFNSEEWLFEQTNYPHAIAHKKAHEELKARVMDIQKRYKNAPSDTFPEEVLDFLNNWLVSHILGVDKKYTKHLNGHGIK